MIKTDFRNMSKTKEFRRKNRAKQPQNGHFAIFFKKSHCIYWESKHSNRLFTVKISVPTNFMYLRKNVPTEMCHKVVNLDLKTALTHNILNTFILTLLQKLLYILLTFMLVSGENIISQKTKYWKKCGIF